MSLRNCVIGCVSERCTHWTVGERDIRSRGLPTMHVEGLSFPPGAVFSVHGTTTFFNCTLMQPVYIFAQKSETPEQMVTTFESDGVLKRRISLAKSDLKCINSSCTHIPENYVHILGHFWEVHITQCTAMSFFLFISIGNKTMTQSLPVVSRIGSSILVESSHFVSGSHLQVYVQSQVSYSSVWVRNAQFRASVVWVYNRGGVSCFHIENCTFIDLDTRGINLKEVACVSIVDCNIKLRPGARCSEGCGVNVQGLFVSDAAWNLVRQMPHFAQLCFLHRSLPYRLDGQKGGATVVHIENTVVESTEAAVTGSAINCAFANLYLFNCYLTMLKDSHLPPLGGIMYFYNVYPVQFEAINITLNAARVGSAAARLSILTTVAMNSFVYDLQNVTILCPDSFNGVEHLEQHSQHILCEQQCHQDEYTFQTGSVVVEGNSNGSLAEPIRMVKQGRQQFKCIPCPIGAKCGNTIQALPNYWGHKNQHDLGTMIRCPDEYCCLSNGTCQSLDSCNEGRTGIICGTCENNLTESLFSPNCFPSEDCQGSLVVVLYIACVVFYGLGLLMCNKVKCLFLDGVKEILKKCLTGKKETQDAAEDSQREEQNTTSDSETDSEADSGMKYMQILFYYVQDATLFKVPLPDERQKDESTIVKLLQFSPQMLTLYKDVSAMCIGGFTAVTKILFNSCFGPCVILVFLLIFGIQKVLFHFLHNHTHMWKSLQGNLMRAFLLSVLFSYQKLLGGAFALVQCVEIEGQTVLYVQGNIQCYTWWQTIVTLYIFLSAVPIFILLSYAPYYIHQKSMSVKVFILACLFPVPVMMCYHLSGLVNARKCRNAQNSHHAKNNQLMCGVGQDSSSRDTVHGEHTVNITLVEQPTDRERQQGSFQADANTQSIGKSDEISGSDTDHESHLEILSTDVRIEGDKSTSQIGGIERALRSDSTPGEKNNEAVTYTDSEVEILHTLLHHYRDLNMFGVQFTWLGIQKLYRIMLVACNAYITDPLPRLFFMTALLIVVTVAHTVVMPYKRARVNTTATLSLAASLCIAMINLWKTGLVLFGCDTNCFHKSVVLSYLDQCQHILLIYVPLVAVLLWLVSTAIQKTCSKSKKD